MTIINRDGSETEIDDNSPIACAYKALEIAALRISRNNAASYIRSAEMNRLHGIRRVNKEANRGAYTITQAHEEIVKAMPDLLEGKITPEEAMALLHGYEVFQERLKS